MSDTAIGDLIASVGCECDFNYVDNPRGHTCLAGRAEAEWKLLDEEREALRADNKTIGDHCNNLVERTVEQDDEIKRLRKALRDILDQWDDHGGVVKMKDIARRALDGEE